MDPLTWTGSLSGLNIIFQIALAVLAIAVLVQIVLSFVATADSREVGADGTLASHRGAAGFMNMIVSYTFFAVLALLVLYLIAGIVMGTGAGIIGGMARQLLPVWVALILTFAASIAYKRKLGLYGKLFDSTVGMIGFALVMFWVFAGVMSGLFDMIITHDTLSQVSGMKNKLPGTPLRGAEEGEYAWYLLGGDNLARDVFSRLIKGSWTVVQIGGLAAWQDDTPAPALPLDRCFPVVFDVDKGWLNARIERRFDQMLEAGALEEAAAQRPFYDPGLPAHRAIGVPELMAYLAGEMTLEAAREAAILATRRYAKRQRTWMRNKMGDWRAVVSSGS